jgi:glycosyltransferase involved in cell wall biosynthesis
MHIVLFSHPSFLHSQSMPRFANMLQKGMQERGHTVELWMPEPQFYNLKAPASLKKWLGYIDQYLLFPKEVKRRLEAYPANTLFVFADHALGPWIPLIKDRPHIVHCHDFLAQRSALGEVQEKPTGWSGRQYQAFIRTGYQQAKNFISVSQKTREDLGAFLTNTPSLSEVVYNGMNRSFSTQSSTAARTIIEKQTGIQVSNGYLLHVGGNQWYKNRVGVIELYNAWRNSSQLQLPLLLIGAKANEALLTAYRESPFNKDIHLLSGMNDATVRAAYAGASLFLFPSLAEGFGWPIAEAMACGCPVITTDEAPMTEVAGKAGFFIPRKTKENAAEWAKEGAQVMETVLQLSESAREAVIKRGLENVKRFDAEEALDRIEAIYQQVLQANTSQKLQYI